MEKGPVIMPHRILICGGGNGAHTLAAAASAVDKIEVNVLTLFKDEAQRWTEILGDDSLLIDVTHNDGTTDKKRGKPRLITNDPSAAMEDVDVIFFVVPAFAHQQYFDAIRQYITHDMIIIGMPGQAGFEFQAIHCLKEKVKKCAILSLESLPWACRLVKFGREVEILGFKTTLGVSLIACKLHFKTPPLTIAQYILGELPVLHEAGNYLAVNLMAKSIIHPPVLYGKWKDWDGKPLSEAPLFYQGVDDVQADLLSKVSDEVVNTAKEIQRQKNDLDMTPVIHIFDWYKEYYHDQISDSTNLKTCMITNKAYNGLLHPMKEVEGGLVPNFSYRYTSEDIPFGLVVMKGIAQCVGVKTPTIDTVITWGQKKLNKEYLIGSELKGKDVGSTRAPQAYGFHSLDDLCHVF